MLSHTDWGVSTFHKFKSNQSNVFQCQLDNLLLKNSHVNFSRNIPFKKLLTSWNLSACSIWERTAFFEVSWSHDSWAKSESIFHIFHLHLPPKDELIKDEICLLKVEDNVQLTHRSEVFVQYFDIPIKSTWKNTEQHRWCLPTGQCRVATKEAQSVEREPVNNLQHIELVISAVHSKAEEKACVALVNNLRWNKWLVLFLFIYFAYLQIFVLYEVAHFRFPMRRVQLMFWFILKNWSRISVWYYYKIKY